MPDGKLLFGRGGLWVNADIRGRMFVFQWLPQFPENPCIYIYIWNIYRNMKGENWPVPQDKCRQRDIPHMDPMGFFQLPNLSTIDLAKVS